MGLLKRWRLWWWLPLTLTGCASMLLPSSPAPVYYQLDYQPLPVHCSRSSPDGVRVWKFTSSSPYDRTEMVVLQPEGQVKFSRSFQWVAKPGTLVSQSLRRDLSAGSLFPQVASPDDPTAVPLELSGHVFVFAWQRTAGSSRAALQVEVSLIDTRDPRKVLLRRGYDLVSPPCQPDNSAAFAQAMGCLMAEFSQKIQQDFCTALSAAGAKGAAH